MIQEITVGTDEPDGPTVNFQGVDADGETAIVRRTQTADYAQYDRHDHPKAYGWWKMTWGTFTNTNPEPSHES